MTFVCPMPMAWNTIYSKLLDAWQASGAMGPKPPVPLILYGWTFSGRLGKHHWWRETVTWAELRRLGHLIPVLREDEQCAVSVLPMAAGLAKWPKADHRELGG